MTAITAKLFLPFQGRLGQLLLFHADDVRHHSFGEAWKECNRLMTALGQTVLRNPTAC